ncbi:mannosyl-oligosaccharide 1,2-alpha-mannosidase IA isoform X2 [Biomphalaria glabrata]|nr:mannosyl-oligosaccharide 1,2-alpha-mannosidase IA isoform X2 [Biomphalaria glabrata]
MAAKGSTTLPLYQRYVNGVPVPQGRKTLRLREKYIILLVFMTFTIVCLCAFMFLPNMQDKVSYDIRKKIDEAGGDLFIPRQRNAPDGSPLEMHIDDDLHKSGRLSNSNNNDLLKNKIETWQKEKVMSEISKILKPEDVEAIKKGLVSDKQLFLEQKKEEERKRKAQLDEEAKKVKKDHEGHPGARGGEPTDPQIKAKRDKVKEMMSHAWHGYEKYGWGANEHRPISLKAHSGSIFGAGELGATIVDAIDTLYIMELDEEFKKARDWVALNLNFDMPADLSVFETNIRFVGGFLSAYALTGDQMFKQKAKIITDKLLPAFNTPTGIPYAIVNLKTGSSRNYGWASGGCSILSELGSLHLEFDYLSAVTNDNTYKDKVLKIRDFMKTIEKPEGFYPNYIHPATGKWCQVHVSMGALGDSFYEYLLKEWLISNKEDAQARQMYDDAMKTVYEKLLVKSKSGLTYFAEYKSGRLEHKMDHLACFTAGMVALGAEGSDNKEKYVSIGADLANTCHESYIRTATGLGPESFRFEGETEAKAIRQNEKYYILRPEVVEGWFYMWRLTKDNKYRDWAWEMVQALEKFCRAEGGFTGIKDVYQVPPQLDDVQQSFFLAETLKYLYLIFSEDSLLPLDKWVFNTEAHPLPVKGVNPASAQ